MLDSVGFEDSLLHHVPGLVLALPFSSLIERRMRKEGDLKTVLPNGFLPGPPLKKRVHWLQAFLKVLSCVRERKAVRPPRGHGLQAGLSLRHRTRECSSRSHPAGREVLQQGTCLGINTLVKFTFPPPLSEPTSCVTCSFWIPNAWLVPGPPDIWYVPGQWEGICYVQLKCSLKFNRRFHPTSQLSTPGFPGLKWK